MTVAKLIAELQKHDPEDDVCGADGLSVDVVGRPWENGRIIEGTVILAHICGEPGAQALIEKFGKDTQENKS